MVIGRHYASSNCFSTGADNGVIGVGWVNSKVGDLEMLTNIFTISSADLVVLVETYFCM